MLKEFSPNGFMGTDLIGSGKKFVAVFDTAEGTTKSNKEITEEILKYNPNVKTVLKKTRRVFGKYRMKKYKILWGDKSTEVIHREYGYILKLDPTKVYFSTRESTIRQKISSRVKKNEIILLMFAGVGPFAIAIAKKQPNVKKIFAIELNPAAYKYLLENIRMNKISHLVESMKIDVRKIGKKFYNKFDRVIMPIIIANQYLNIAVKFAKNGGIIDAYFISKEKDFKDVGKFLDKTLKKLKIGYKILHKDKIALYAPRKWKVAFEIRVKK